MNRYKTNLISIVIPCYNSEKSIGSVIDEIIDMFQKQSTFDYEIILVNDNSRDDTWTTIKKSALDNEKIIAMDFSKNFGQASAIMAGLVCVEGEYVISMDDDGQMPIESIFDLITQLKKGYDIAFGKYEKIKQKWYRNMGSWVNLKMNQMFLGQPKDVNPSSFWAAKRYVIDQVIMYKGPYPYISGLLLRVTRNMVNINVKQRERLYGKSGYSFIKLLSLWMNGFTAFSVKPLRFATFTGAVSAITGFIFAIIMVIRHFTNPKIPVGYASTIILLLVIGGIIMMLLGMIGEYVGRIYISLNNAPQYIIKDIVDHRKTNKGE